MEELKKFLYIYFHLKLYFIDGQLW